MMTLFPCLSPARLAALPLLLSAALPLAASAAAPAWWQARSVMNVSQTSNDYAAINTGQLKHMAQQAMLELDLRLPNGAGTAIHDMVTAWSAANPERNDFAAVNIGQLKAVAKPFYDRLNGAGLALAYPWSPATLDRNDFAAVNIGQLKHVFSFAVPDVTTVDSDTDGLPDWWETHFFASLSAEAATTDTDGDGMTNLQEWQYKTSPNATDTDGDTWEDGVEVAAGAGVLNNATIPTSINPTFLNDYVTIKEAFAWRQQSYSMQMTEDFSPSHVFYNWISTDILMIGGEFLRVHNGPNSLWENNVSYAVGFGGPAWPPPNPLLSDVDITNLAQATHWQEPTQHIGGQIVLTPPFFVNEVSHPVTQPSAWDSMGNVTSVEASGWRTTSHGVSALSLSVPFRLPVSVTREYFVALYDVTDNPLGTLHRIQRLEFIVPAHQTRSNIKIIQDDNLVLSENREIRYYDLRLLDPEQFQGMALIEKAPAVLAVNSDFDEGNVAGTPPFAVPDSASGTLKAVRDHLDDNWEEDEIVTDELHEGFFGMRPGVIPYELSAGAVVTIRKLDKDDPETSRKQSGHVRLHAVWGEEGSESEMQIEPYDKDTLAPINLGPLLYTQAPNTPVTYYLEGVEAGKITLEFSYQKGDASFSYQQEFLVATQKTREEWREEVRYQIRLQESSFPSGSSHTDLADLNPALGFRHPQPEYDNSRLISLMYYYYAQLFVEHPEEFMWPGMARVAASSIYAGMSDMYLWNTNPVTGGEAGAVSFLNNFMIPGAQAIFEDLAWSHHAYAASGIYALKHVSTTELDSVELATWKTLDQGIAENDISLIHDAAEDLLSREQNEVVQAYYTAIGSVRFIQPGVHYLWTGIWMGGVYVTPGPDGKVEVGEWMSANSTVNPILDMQGDNAPLAFRVVVPGGRLDNPVDRWSWISHGEYGMLPRWSGTSSAAARNYTPVSRMAFSNQNLHDSASIFSKTLGAGLPPW